MSNAREVGVRFKVGADGLSEAFTLRRSLKDLGGATRELEDKATELASKLANLRSAVGALAIASTHWHRRAS